MEVFDQSEKGFVGNVLLWSWKWRQNFHFGGSVKNKKLHKNVEKILKSDCCFCQKPPITRVTSVPRGSDRGPGARCPCLNYSDSRSFDQKCEERSFCFCFITEKPYVLRGWCWPTRLLLLKPVFIACLFSEWKSVFLLKFRAYLCMWEMYVWHVVLVF